jgi:NAD(P)-dependent dehydrogenase (short-subunit alcohol dehydrogenase family)
MAETDSRGMTVVITGEGRGATLGIARRFGQAGAHAVVAGRDANFAADATDGLRAEGLSASFEPLDVRDPMESERVVQKVTAEHGKIDIWVNNAAIFHTGPAENLPRKWWDATMAVNLSGVFYCCQAAARHMLSRGQGVIVNVAAADGYKPVEGRVAYSVAEAGVIMLTQALGIEWASRGIRVVGIAPGAIADASFPDEVEGSTQLYERRTPLGRLGTVEELAEAVLFLAGNEASYLTAETMRVDGGWVAYQLF